MFGPNLIERFVQYQFKDDVKLYRVEVSPKLEVSAAIVEIMADRELTEQHKSTFLRGVEIGLNYENSLGLTLQVRHLETPDAVELENVYLELFPADIFDWSKISVAADLKSANIRELEMSDVAITSNILYASLDAVDIDVFSPRITYTGLQLPLTAQAVHLKSDKIQLSESIGNKLTAVDVTLEELALGSNVNAKRGTIQAVAQSQIADFEIILTDISETYTGSSSSSLTFSTNDLDLSGPKYTPINFDARQVSSPMVDASINSVNGMASFQTEGFEVIAQSDLVNLKLSSGELYLGELPDALVSSKLAWTVDQVLSTNQISLELGAASSSGLKLSAVAKADMEPAQVVKCWSLQCEFSDFLADLAFTTPRSQMSIQSRCSSNLCGVGELNHTLFTSNTAEFFEDLVSMRAFSPIAIPLAYTVMQSGTPTGDGHVKKF